jgi:hypothetical protein
MVALGEIGKTMDIIDFSAEKGKRINSSDPNVMADDKGVPLYRFLLSYRHNGAKWAYEIWAYSRDDAAQRVEAMRESLVLDGPASQIG